MGIAHRETLILVVGEEIGLRNELLEQTVHLEAKLPPAHPTSEYDNEGDVTEVHVVAGLAEDALAHSKMVLFAVAEAVERESRDTVLKHIEVALPNLVPARVMFHLYHEAMCVLEVVHF